jgi:transcription elongation regulator 1
MQVKESIRDDPRYKSVKHEDRELLFNEYISELKSAEHAAERETRAKREEQVLSGLELRLNMWMSFKSTKS